MVKILAADIGGTALKAGIVRDGKVVKLKKVLSRAGEGKEVLLRVLSETLDSLRTAGIGGIGVSTAGSVDAKTGSVYYATNAIPGWAGTRLKDWLEERYGLPAAVENDGRAAARAEMAYGGGRRVRSFIFITIGTGLGGAVVLEGKIADSPASVRPEGLGHFPLEPGGFTCHCGKRGCWEAQASLTGLRKKFHGLCLPSEKEWDAKKIFDAAESGNGRAQGAVGSFIRDLGRGLAVLNRRFHPEKFILGGAVSERGKAFLRSVQAGLKALDQAWETEVALSSLGNEAGMLGAAYLAARKARR